MSLPDAPIMRMLGLAEGEPLQLRKRISKLVGISRDARELFLLDDGGMKPAAERFFARVAREAQFNRIGFDPDARHQDYRKGQQDLLRLMMGMIELDHRQIDELQRRLGDR